MTCRRCGAATQVADRYCGVCGAPVGSSATPGSVAPVPGTADRSRVDFVLAAILVALVGLLLGGGVGWLVTG